MSTRSTRRSQGQPLLSPLESLLLAQAAWQLGAGSNSWSAIAKLLSKHPLLSRPKAFFTAQVRIFNRLQHLFFSLSTHAVLSCYV